MAIGWLSVLKMVPWGDVIESAPKVAQGAKKLWDTVGKKPTPAAAPDATELTEPQAGLAALQAQVLQLQQASAELHQQMLASTALIQSLAEQNTQLIARVEVNRKRVIGLMLVVTALAVTLAWRYLA
jgi:hypothetical protein